MKKKNRGIPKVIFAFFVCYSILVLFSIYGKDVGPWEGRVVDIDTGEPLKNSVVLVVWYGKAFGILDWVPFFHRSAEAITDKEGYFRISRYYPFNFFPVISRIEFPQFSVFKPGYFYVDNVRYSTFKKDSTKKTEEITRNLSKEYSFTYRVSSNIIELPSLSNIKEEDRWKYFLPSRPSVVPQDQMINFTKAINEARNSLGYKPLSLPGAIE